MNSNGNVAKECLKKTSIKNMIRQHNKMHFRKVCSSNAFRDSMHAKLKFNHIRDKTLNSALERSDCNDSGVYNFLGYLKNQENMSRILIV